MSLFEGLTRLRPDNNQAEPGVAEKWEISDDGRVYTFHFRDNARWSNGEPRHGARFSLFDSPIDRSADVFALFLSGVVHRECKTVQLERQHACRRRSGRSRAQSAA